jgi:bifunctional non-homologous end joining protein LigD
LNLQDYSDQHQNVKPNASIKERWQKRVVTRGLSGAEGARQYLADYGRGIGAKKVIMLARQAEIQCDIPMSEIFWGKAHELELGEPARGSLKVSWVPIPDITPQQEVSLEGLPDDMQPGEIVTAQPVDARCDREHYINSPYYFGQAKIDGQKALAFVTPSQVVYQSRSMRVRETPSVEMDEALMAAAARSGPFILEGELTYLDFEGGEHRTGAQAATYNIDHDRPTVQPEMKFFIFDCLYYKDDLRRESKQTRLWEAETLCLYIQNAFEAL